MGLPRPHYNHNILYNFSDGTSPQGTHADLLAIGPSIADIFDIIRRDRRFCAILATAIFAEFVTAGETR
jgi:hypothetical protein